MRGGSLLLTVRNLGGDVVGNVGLGDTVHEVRSDGTHQVAVNGAEGSTGEGPLSSAVVGDVGVGVLEVGDLSSELSATRRRGSDMRLTRTSQWLTRR